MWGGYGRFIGRNSFKLLSPYVILEGLSRRNDPVVELSLSRTSGLMACGCPAEVRFSGYSSTCKNNGFSSRYTPLEKSE
jgi:hypothetical protein